VGKLLALLAKTQGWKPEKGQSLKGLNPFINLGTLKELKKIVSAMQFSEPEIAKEKVKETSQKVKKLKTETKKSPEAKKQASEEKSQFKELKQKALEWGIDIYGVSFEELKEAVAKIDVKISLGATYKNPQLKLPPFNPANPTPQQHKAVHAYTNGLYQSLNNALRDANSKKLKPSMKELAHYLDEILATSSYKGPIYRGISEYTLAKWQAQTNGFKKGAVLTDAGYGSFSSSESFAKGWKKCRIQAINGGENCADISKLS